jgi:hypothetical protein
MPRASPPSAASTRWLYTNKLFAANLGFYERLGYAIDREEPFMGGAVVHMRKAIDGAES